MDVLIVGAGIAGMTLGLCLERRGLGATIVERAPGVRAEGSMLDFFGPGYDAAEAMGLLPKLERIHQPIARLRFVRPDGREAFSLDYPALRRLLRDRHVN